MKKLILIAMCVLCSSFIFSACTTKKEDSATEETDSQKSIKDT